MLQSTEASPKFNQWLDRDWVSFKQIPKKTTGCQDANFVVSSTIGDCWDGSW